MIIKGGFLEFWESLSPEKHNDILAVNCDDLLSTSAPVATQTITSSSSSNQILPSKSSSTNENNNNNNQIKENNAGGHCTRCDRVLKFTLRRLNWYGKAGRFFRRDANQFHQQQHQNRINSSQLNKSSSSSENTSRSKLRQYLSFPDWVHIIYESTHFTPNASQRVFFTGLNQPKQNDVSLLSSSTAAATNSKQHVSSSHHQQHNQYDHDGQPHSLIAPARNPKDSITCILLKPLNLEQSFPDLCHPDAEKASDLISGPQIQLSSHLILNECSYCCNMVEVTMINLLTFPYPARKCMILLEKQETTESIYQLFFNEYKDGCGPQSPENPAIDNLQILHNDKILPRSETLTVEQCGIQNKHRLLLSRKVLVKKGDDELSNQLLCEKQARAFVGDMFFGGDKEEDEEEEETGGSNFTSDQNGNHDGSVIASTQFTKASKKKKEFSSLDDYQWCRGIEIIALAIEHAVKRQIRKAWAEELQARINSANLLQQLLLEEEEDLKKKGRKRNDHSKGKKGSKYQQEIVEVVKEDLPEPKEIEKDDGNESDISSSSDTVPLEALASKNKIHLIGNSSKLKAIKKVNEQQQSQKKTQSSNSQKETKEKKKNHAKIEEVQEKQSGPKTKVPEVRKSQEPQKITEVVMAADNSTKAKAVEQIKAKPKAEEKVTKESGSSTTASTSVSKLPIETKQKPSLTTPSATVSTSTPVVGGNTQATLACPSCGTTILVKNSRFCSMCGIPLNMEAIENAIPVSIIKPLAENPSSAKNQSRLPFFASLHKE